MTGEHRDRELAKRQWTRAKPGIYPARQETSDILHSSQGDHATGLMAQKAPHERTVGCFLPAVKDGCTDQCQEHTFFDLSYASTPLFTFHSSLFTFHFLIPGFRKHNVSRKRVTGEHRDRELCEAAMDEGKK